LYDTLASRYGYTIDQFADLTMRQLVGLMKTINKNKVVEFYYQIVSYTTGTRIQKVPTLEEFLNVSLGGDDEKPNSFDEQTDKILEQQALKRLNERSATNG